MYSCANLLSYSFYIESSLISLIIYFYILYVLYTIMCMNQINNNKFDGSIAIKTSFET